ncbi:MAG: M23 family metallopeptidase [Deltaproteobacteria bacterium]|nr:M23 family metallopeptidase [Deltaproteobacteria bacterium]
MTVRPLPAGAVNRPALRGTGTLLLVAMMAVAVPSTSRLGASGSAAWRVARRGGGDAWSLLLAVLRPRELSPFASGGRGSAWAGVGEGALLPPPANGSPHEAALARAAEQGWVKCGGAAACTAALHQARQSLPDELALEAVALGDPGGDRVKAAVAAAESAGLERPRELSVHAPFLPHADRARAEEVERVLGLATLWSLQWPLPNGTRITSPFGERVHPVTGEKKFHDGVDLAAVTGTPLAAPAGARVLHVGQDAVSGTYVVLDHGHQVQSVACHLSEAEVKRGAAVAPGATYARTGASGRVTGPHLHYGVRVGGKFVDPAAAAVRRQAAPR